MRVLVLCGGESVERNVSLASGNSVGEWLIAAGHEVFKYDPEEPGVVHEGNPQLGGDEIGLAAPRDVLHASERSKRLRGLMNAIDTVQPDIVFPILHGGMGEDGTVQATLEMIGVPYTGSGPRASAIAMHKELTRKLLGSSGIPVCRGFSVSPDRALDASWVMRELRSSFDYPAVFKPLHGGSTVGLTKVYRDEEVPSALEAIATVEDLPLIEEHFEGKELTATVVDGECYPLVEIRAREGFYDYANKYSAERTDYIVPAELPPELTSKIQADAAKAFEIIGCDGFARIDFLASNSEYVCLEVNTLPGMTAGFGLVPKAAKAHGMAPEQLVQKILDCAMRKTVRLAAQ